LGASYFAKAENQSAAGALASQRRGGYENEGGSNYRLDAPEGEASERTTQQELLLAPLGLATALFRPLFFEARNVVQFANALEATGLLILVIQVFRRLGVRRIMAEIASSPALLFCVVFTLGLGLGTGLSSANLGTLSRYRAPMMPFYFTVVMMLRFGIKQVRSPARSLAPVGVQNR
jgi:hypothetical protein